MKRRTLRNTLGRLVKSAIQPNMDRPERVVIITGIPRSGTSLFCSLLNRVNGVVCFNEIFYDVRTLPYDLKRMRRRLIRGEPVPNKYDKTGGVVTDTMDQSDVRWKALPIQGSSVVIGTNVNVPYLHCIQKLLDLGCPIVVLVRDPVYTVASWSTSRTAWIPEAQVGPPDSEVHTRWKDVSFKGSTPVERRAEVWNELAVRILEYKESLQVVRYEDLVADPNAQLRPLLKGFNLRSNIEPLKNMNLDARFAQLDAVRRAIGQFAPAARYFGYAARV